MRPFLIRSYRRSADEMGPQGAERPDQDHGGNHIRDREITDLRDAETGRQHDEAAAGLEPGVLAKHAGSGLSSTSGHLFISLSRQKESSGVTQKILKISAGDNEKPENQRQK